MTLRRQILVPALAAAWLSACSAVVSPDESELDPTGSGDAGGGGIDSGGTDAGGEDADVPPVDGGADTGPGCPGGCDDGVACTVDRCVGGECEHEVDDDLCEADERCNPTAGCVQRICTDDSHCDDGLPCNGAETCDPDAEAADPETGCVDGTALVCDDGAACTTDTCDDDAGGCVYSASDAACDDGIDCTVDSCDPGSATDPSGCLNIEDDSLCDTGYCSVGGACSIAAGGCEGGDVRDCGDDDPCTADTCSESMMMCVHEGVDEDGDGATAARVGETACTGGTDCNDLDPTVHPGATEYCNGRNDDCDGDTDESCTTIPDDCGDAEEIELDASGDGSVSGTINVFTADYRTVCGMSGGRDAVYYIELDSLSDVTIDTIGSTADTVLAVGLGCGNSDFRMGCDHDIDTGVDQDSRIWVHRIGPPIGTPTLRLYILVDTFDETGRGDYVVNVSVRPARADTCASPIDISGGGSFVGRIGIGGERGSCQDPADSSAEAIASFTGPPDGDFRFIALSNDFAPDLYVREAPCNTGTEVDCDHASGGGGYGYSFANIYEDSVTPGSTYYLFVDGASAGDQYFVSFEP